MPWISPQFWVFFMWSGSNELLNSIGIVLIGANIWPVKISARNFLCLCRNCTRCESTHHLDVSQNRSRHGGRATERFRNRTFPSRSWSLFSIFIYTYMHKWHNSARTSAISIYLVTVSRSGQRKAELPVRSRHNGFVAAEQIGSAALLDHFHSAAGAELIKMDLPFSSSLLLRYHIISTFSKR